MRRTCTFLLAAALAVSAGLPLSADAQQQPPQQPFAAAPQAQQHYTTGRILGVQGYYEVTPAGAIVLYPATPVTAPGVLHTILGMFGGGSLVGQRGFFQITPQGELFLYFPPGTAWHGRIGHPQPPSGTAGGMPGYQGQPAYPGTQGMQGWQGGGQAPAQ